MPKVKQLTIPCENRPGRLAQITTVMGKSGVNILGFLLTTSGKRGLVKLVVDDVERAKDALDDADVPYNEEVVLHATLANVPGALGRFAEKLAAKRINITSGYQTLEKDSKRASVILEVSQLGKAIRVASRTSSDQLYD
ncbi:MAG: ACT domain-containing protein [Acidobacteria bacterium]|nr:ACT domain-containing protein [Acidobacteriota bacterium]